MKDRIDEKLALVASQNQDHEAMVLFIKKLRSREEDPKYLHPHKYMEVLEWMKMQGFSNMQMASILQRCEGSIRNHLIGVKVKFAESMAKGGWKSLLGNFMMTSQTLIDQALKTGNAELAWRIEKETFDRLQSMGMIPEAPKEFKIHDDSDGSDGVAGTLPGDKLSSVLFEFARRIAPKAAAPDPGALPQ